MAKIYLGQTDLTIYLNTGKDITGATSVKVMYKKPDETEGEFIGTIDNATQGIIKYVVTNANDLDQLGRWFFWAKIVNAQGKISIGNPDTILMEQEGTIK